MAAALAALVCSQAIAWGDLGHEVTALIAYRHLSPTARAALDALLASDPDPLTSGDFAGRATWADKYRNAHRETAVWHFVDIEIDHPDLNDACFGFPGLHVGQLASEGPAQDCVVNKIEEFAAELKNPSTPAAERILALKFLIHFLGDLHQPLHAADHHDRGRPCAPPMSRLGLEARREAGPWIPLKSAGATSMRFHPRQPAKAADRSPCHRPMWARPKKMPSRSCKRPRFDWRRCSTMRSVSAGTKVPFLRRQDVPAKLPPGSARFVACRFRPGTSPPECAAQR